MKRKAQPLLSANGQQALDQYTQVLEHLEDLSAITIRNYLSDLRQFIAWYECSWYDGQENRSFTPQVVAHALSGVSPNDARLETIHREPNIDESETLFRLDKKNNSFSPIPPVPSNLSPKKHPPLDI